MNQPIKAGTWPIGHSPAQVDGEGHYAVQVQTISIRPGPRQIRSGLLPEDLEANKYELYYSRQLRRTQISSTKAFQNRNDPSKSEFGQRRQLQTHLNRGRFEVLTVPYQNRHVYQDAPSRHSTPKIVSSFIDGTSHREWSQMHQPSYSSQDRMTFAHETPDPAGEEAVGSRFLWGADPISAGQDR